MHAACSFGFKSLLIMLSPPVPHYSLLAWETERCKKNQSTEGCGSIKTRSREKMGWRFLLFPGLAGSQGGPGSFGWDTPRSSEGDPRGTLMVHS